MDECKVWIAKRKCDDGHTTYHLRWIDPVLKRWKSQKAGDDEEKAKRQAGALEQKLRQGWHGTKRVGWEGFVEDHIGKIQGDKDRIEAKRTLEEFGKLCSVKNPKGVTYGSIERYVKKLRDKGNSVATINKKLRYLRGAFNKAIRRGFLATNPMAGWEWTREDDTAPRIVTEDEEAALLKAAKDTYGEQWRSFVYVALNTGGRRSELLGLAWDHVTLDGDEPQLHFAHTKGKRDRYVPLNPDVVTELRKLKASTQLEGGPFVAINNHHLDEKWEVVRDKAGLPDVNPHDLRRTYCARLIRAGVALPTVQRLMGHSNITTTITFYHWVSPEDLRAGVAKLAKVPAVG